MENCFNYKYNLSTNNYYFKYRHDKYNPEVIRATLYNLKDEIVDDVRKSEGFEMPEKTHYDIINYFETRIEKNKIIKM